MLRRYDFIGKTFIKNRVRFHFVAVPRSRQPFFAVRNSTTSNTVFNELMQRHPYEQHRQSEIKCQYIVNGAMFFLALATRFRIACVLNQFVCIAQESLPRLLQSDISFSIGKFIAYCHKRNMSEVWQSYGLIARKIPAQYSENLASRTQKYKPLIL